MIEYTKLSDALAELEKRKHLRPRIEAFLAEQGVGLPWAEDLGGGKPLAVLFRQIATPNYEITRFLSIASGFGMQPLILEYLGDKLSLENPYKKSLVCLPIVKRISPKGHVQFERNWICDPSSLRPQTILSEIATKDGTLLPDFHHRLMAVSPFSKTCEINDGTKWFHSAGGNASDYYNFFFPLFISHAILFENFLAWGTEASFTEKVIGPSFVEASDLFGYKPLVVPINPTETEDEAFWVCYPKEVLE